MLLSLMDILYISSPQTFQGRSIMVDSTPRDILDGSTLITTHTDPEKGVTLKSQPHIIVSWNQFNPNGQ